MTVDELVSYIEQETKANIQKAIDNKNISMASDLVAEREKAIACINDLVDRLSTARELIDQQQAVITQQKEMLHKVKSTLDSSEELTKEVGRDSDHRKQEKVDAENKQGH